MPQPTPPRTSATNERAIRARDDRIKQDRLNDELVVQSLMSLPGGRRWVWLQLEFARLFQSNELLDPYYMAFEKGKRVAALKLLADVQVFCPQLYIKMTEENTAFQFIQQEDDPDGGPDADPSAY